MTPPPTVGDPAPDLTLRDAAGSPVRLADLWSRGPLVVYFYPKDFTPGCTAQACAFRDAYEDFTDAGAAVIGISADTGDSHAKFASRHTLPFTLLADPDGQASRAFGVPRTFGFLPGRVTYVIARDGIVRHIFNSQLRPKRHVAEALRIIRELSPLTAPPPTR